MTDKLSWREITDDVRDRLLVLYSTGVLENRHAVELGIHPETLRRRLREWKKKREAERQVHSSEATWMPDSESPDYDDYIVLHTDDFVVISDIEIPDHDPAMLEAALLIGIEKNIKTLIIAGDLLATDMPTLTAWSSVWVEMGQPTYNSTIGTAIEIISRFMEWFEKIIVIQGNHDDRIDRKTGGEVWIEMLMRELYAIGKEKKSTVVFTRYHYMYVKTNRGTFWVTHPDNYSTTPVGMGQQMATTENGPDYDPTDPYSKTEKVHVIVTHTHIYQEGRTKDNAREIHCLGCLRNPRKTKYKSQKANKFPEWSQSFGYSKAGYFRNLERWSTNWVEELGKSGKNAEILGIVSMAG